MDSGDLPEIAAENPLPEEVVLTEVRAEMMRRALAGMAEPCRSC